MSLTTKASVARLEFCFALADRPVEALRVAQ